MAEGTHIQWTDNTFNPWWGCTKVSDGCKHCYAEDGGVRKHAVWGPHTRRVMMAESTWKEPERWNRRAERSGVRERVFCGSMCDIFEDDPDVIEARDLLWRLTEKTPNLDWQLLTKRPENILKMVPRRWLAHWPPHVWVGVSVENQEVAEERIPLLLEIPAQVRFLSCEPLLGELNLTAWLKSVRCCFKCNALLANDGPVNVCEECDVGGWFPERRLLTKIHWVIAGGESGKRARPAHPDWIRGLRDQCVERGVPFFFKQWGEHTSDLVKIGKKRAGRVLDGREWNQFPRTNEVRPSVRGEGSQAGDESAPA